MRRRVLVAGAGVAALEALLALRHLAGDRIELDLVAPVSEFVLRPLSVLEPFGRGEAARIPLSGVLREHGAGHVPDRIVAVDAERKRVTAAAGDEYAYDALVIATGARPVEALPGALTFPGQTGVTEYRRLLEQIDRGSLRRLAFAVPPKTTWALPIYELALLTAGWLFERRDPGMELTVVTPEQTPLSAFGPSGSAAVAKLLSDHGIALRTGVRPQAVGDLGLELDDGQTVGADRVVALPRLVGSDLDGVPGDEEGFVPVDDHGRVSGLADVYAAGDVTARPVKQGGLAAQQADAAAESVAEWAGAPIRPTPFRPELRGVLLTPDEPLHMRADTRPHHERSIARLQPLWWPPAKVAGQYLSPYLAARGVPVAG